MANNQKEKNIWLRKILYELSENEGLNQKEVAQSVGISPTYLSAVSQGRRQLTDSLVYKLCKKYKLTAPEEDRVFRENQQQYEKSSAQELQKAIERHNQTLQANLEDLRKNIEDLRRENEQISNYINHLKSK